MHFLIDLILQYGYFVIFLGTLLEGETFVALGGLIAYQGDLDLAILIPIAIIGSIAGDQMFFYIGRWKGRKLLSEHPEWNMRVQKINGWMATYHNWLIVGSRFLYGFRMIIPIVLGTSTISGVRYFFLDLIGAIIWANFFAFLGYFFGSALERFLGNIKKFEGIIALTVVLIVVCVQVIALQKRRALKNQGIAEAQKKA